MTTKLSAVMDTARQAAEATPAERLLERLADRIGARASVGAVFGEPIERGEITVVPVARVRWGFGGGAGGADQLPEAPGDAGAASWAGGGGGGGGATADPIGYLEIGPDGATFRPIAAAYPSPLFLFASGVTAAIVLRALARLLRR
jgi:uncharacterized spore protein YtfJ